MAIKLLALKIVPATYEVYQASGAPQESLSVVNNLFVVKNPDYPGGWEFYEERDFRKTYRWMKEPPQSFTEFSPVYRLPDEDAV